MVRGSESPGNPPDDSLDRGNGPGGEHEQTESAGLEAVRKSFPDVDAPAFASSLLTSREFDQQRHRQEFLIDNILVAGQPCVAGGRSKTLKTSIAGIDMAISLGSGTPFLGHFQTRQSTVAFWSGEAGAAVIQAKARRVAESRGVELEDCNVLWSFDLPKLGQELHVAAMGELIEQREINVIVIDPLYLSLLGSDDASQAGNVFAMGAKLLPLSELCQRTGVTPVLLHHFRKGFNDGSELTLEALSQAGIAEWARQWLLFARRSPYQHDGLHELWMSAGGSSGHSGFCGIDIDEGTIDEDFDGRKWETVVGPGHEIEREKRDAKQKAKADKKRDQCEADQKAIIRAFVDRVETGDLLRDEGVFKTKLGEWTRLSDERVKRALDSLTDQGIAETCKGLMSPRHNNPSPGAFRLTADWWQEQEG